MNNELTDIITGHNPSFYPKWLFFFWQVVCSCCGWPAIITTAKCISLFFFVRTVWNNTNQGWKLTPSIQPTVDTILTVASNYVYSIHYLSEWSFQPAGSPVKGVLLVWAVLAHSFLLCLVSFCKPTTSTVFFLFTTRVLTSPFFQAVQCDAMQDSEDSMYLFSFYRAGRPIFVVFPGFSWNLLDIWLDIYEMPPILSLWISCLGQLADPTPATLA